MRTMGYCNNCGCRECTQVRKSICMTITDEEFTLIKLEKPILALKSIRNRTGMSLRDCKIVVDRYTERG